MAVRQGSIKDSKWNVVKEFLEKDNDTYYGDSESEVINAAFDNIIAREGLLNEK